MMKGRSSRTVKKWLDIFAAHYGHKAQEDEAEVIRSVLSELDSDVVEKACFRAMKDCEFFPKLSHILRHAGDVELLKRGRMFVRATTYAPIDHGCKIRQEKITTSPRRVLFELSPYEGIHVLCPGKTRPRCGQCGTVQEPFENPLAVELMRQYPVETKSWNPLYKGMLLCRSCEQLRWPRDFLNPGNVADGVQ